MTQKVDSVQNEGSVLDRVLQSKQTKELHNLQPLEVIEELFRELSEKERDVLRRRFGLQVDDKESLESIGKSYGLTRERIRQVEGEAIRKIRESAKLHDFLQHIESLLATILEEHGGAMEEEHLFERLLEVAGDTGQHRQSLLFIMDKLSEKFEAVRRAERWLPGWKLTASELTHLEDLLEAALTIIKAEKRPLEFQALHEQMKGKATYQQHNASEPMLLSVLKLAKDIDENPYGEFGLLEWPEIKPRRMGDKIYIVLKKHGQPLHFVEIAEHINKAGFDRKRALPQTVHNELIVDPRFVLIGRGIYALAEWGYQPGIVSDVITTVLQEAQQPLTKEQIIDAVLKKRRVKPATIYISLINKDRFQKLPDGRYALTASAPVGE